MLIKVVFKEHKSNQYDNQEFTYKGYDNAEVGDIIVVNTRYGYAIARVTDVDVKDSMFNENNIATVKIVIKSMAKQRQEIERKEIHKALVERIRIAKIEKEIKNYLADLDDDENYNEIFADMTAKEIEDFYKALKA